MSLELYAKIEPLIPFKEEKQKLYNLYLKKLKKIGAKKILDLGCGGGNFMQLAIKENFEIDGIDLSHLQIEMAKSKGLNAQVLDIKDVKEKYDAIVGVFDVINYIKKEELEFFLQNIQNALYENGTFLCDINTFYAFEEIAPGDLILEKDEICAAIRADFDDNILQTQITLFEKNTKECYKKIKDSFLQYYYSLDFIKKINPFKNLKVDYVKLYTNKTEKYLLEFKK